MDRRYSPLLLGISLAAGCLQKVDDGLASGTREVDPPACGPGQAYACMFPVNTTTPAVGLNANAAGDVIDSVDAGDGCAKVDLDAVDILQRKCSGCHEGAGTAINSQLTFILQPDQLISTPSSMQFNGEPYVLPGNPAGSLIYQRAVINKDMPYSPSTLALPNFLTVTESSVLYQWIASCIAPMPTTGGAGAGGVGAGGVGAGGVGVSAGGVGAGGVGAGGVGVSAGGVGAGGVGPVGMATGREAAGIGGALGVGGAYSGGTGGAATAGAGGVAAGGSAGAAGAGGTVAGGSAGAAGAGGAAAGGSAGALGNALPCAGLCQAPTVFTVPPAYQSPGFGPNAACYQTLSPLAGFTCSNAARRTFFINGTTVNCGSPPAINTIPRRNGGYCVQANGGGNQAAFFNAN